MPRSRFCNLQRYLHLFDSTTVYPRGHPEYDALHKIRPLLSRVQQTIREGYNPGQNILVDRAKVSQRRSGGVQYFSSKSKKSLLEVWTLSDTATGYVCGITADTARRSNYPQNGFGYDVVMELVADYKNKYHHCYFDQNFTSIKLLEDLLASNTYACGRVSCSRSGLPADIRKPPRMDTWQSIKKQRGQLLAVVWHDRADLKLISTNCQSTDGTMKRRLGPKVVNVACPNVVLNYNKYVGAADTSDHNRSHYDVGTGHQNQWKGLMWFLLNTCVVNSYVIYKETMQAAGKQPCSELVFRQKLLHQLIGGFSSRKRSVRQGVKPPILEESQFPGHVLVKATKKICRNCSQLGNKTVSGRCVQSSFKCEACNVNLCMGGCLIAFHTRHMKKS